MTGRPAAADEERQLVCAECWCVSEAGAVAWRAYLDDDEVFCFCPTCAAREFDGE